MKFVGILVEGQAEEGFIQNVLNPYLIPKGLFLNATIVKTKRSDEGSFKGGVSNYAKIEKDLRLLFHNTSNIATTTMFDLYGFPSDFPNFQDNEAQSKRGRDFALYLEEKWQAKFPNQRNFIPYLAVHEFEAQLFSVPSVISQIIPETDKSVTVELQKIRDAYNNPEEINLKQPPSKRILKLIPTYQKLANGISIAEYITISKMREECPHFNAWLSKLESLAE